MEFHGVRTKSGAIRSSGQLPDAVPGPERGAAARTPDPAPDPAAQLVEDQADVASTEKPKRSATKSVSPGP